jgi:hypothetical protein
MSFDDFKTIVIIILGLFLIVALLAAIAMRGPG